MTIRWHLTQKELNSCTVVAEDGEYVQEIHISNALMHSESKESIQKHIESLFLSAKESAKEKLRGTVDLPEGLV